MLRLLLLALPCLAAEPAAYPDRLTAAARFADLAEDPQWLALGHWRRRRGGWESPARGKDFFVAAEGKRDPAAELEADLRAFFSAADTGEHAQTTQCRFPARYAWLKRRLAFDGAMLKGQVCPRYEEWRAGIDASSVTLVFADAYLNNPGSMYGHTFLRLPRAGEKEGEGLLDYTINFAGNPDTDNGFLYAVRGITGAFPGTYSTEPFYMKVQEYTNMESRDLWEYDLNLSADEVDMLLRHAWEMGGTSFDYYFFSANCSYQLLTLVDAARPALHLADGFGFGTAPADTVRAFLARPGLVGARRYRPAHVTVLRARRAALSAEERALTSALASGVLPSSTSLSSLPAERQAWVLDAADDLLRLRSGFSNELPAEQAVAERALLVARGRLGRPALAPEIARARPLEDGHDVARVGLGAGVSRFSSFEELAYRPALHDFFSPDVGYLADSELKMMEGRLRLDNKERVPYVEKLDLVSIVAVSPWDSWLRKVSWKVSTGIDQAKELGCGPVACMHYDLDAGFGLAAQSHLVRRELYYLFAEADAGAAPVFARGWRAGGGGTVGLSLNLAEGWRTSVEASYLAYAYSPARERLRLISVWRLSRDAELRLNLDRRVPEEEAGLQFGVYF